MLTIRATKKLDPTLGIYDFDREATVTGNHFNLRAHAIGVKNDDKPNPQANVDFESATIECEATFKGQVAADQCLELLRTDGWTNAECHVAA